MDAEESQALFNYIVKKEYPLNLTKDEKRRLREKSGSFCVSNADLIHIGADNKRTRVIVANEEKTHLIETMHEDIGGGHFGQSAKIRKISERLWTPGISEAVREYLWT